MSLLSTDEVIERDELAAKLAGFYMSGFIPSYEDAQRAKTLGLDPNAIREAVDVCYESGEDEA